MKDSKNDKIIKSVKFSNKYNIFEMLSNEEYNRRPFISVEFSQFIKDSNAELELLKNLLLDDKRDEK
jgi:hypothetical protein